MNIKYFIDSNHVMCESNLMIHRCTICQYEYDDSRSSPSFDDLPEDWLCPLCGVGKDLFEALPEATEANNTLGATQAERLIGTLCDMGLSTCFGMVGHSNLGIADALRQEAQAGRMRFITMRHEGAAAFAAAAYGKLTGKPAACLSISGPGATNMATGMGDALLDRAPMLALMGQVPTTEAGMKIFQELDLEKTFAPLSVGQWSLQSQANASSIAQSAWSQSILRQGPVQLILPDNLQTEQACCEGVSAPAPLPAGLQEAAPQALEAAKNLIAAAKNPIIILGYGGRAAIAEAVALAQLLQAPIMTTYRARGYIADSAPLSCGVIGRSGNAVARHFSTRADLIIAVGVGFSRHAGIALEGKKVVRIDCKAEALHRLCTPDVALLSEARPALNSLREMLVGAKLACTPKGGEVAEQWQLWRAEKASRAAQNAPRSISPAYACELLSAAAPENALISFDVGNVTYSAGRYFEAKGQQRFTLSWYLGSIGVGLPAAIGAWAATQEAGSELLNRPVIAVVGDGGLGQYLAELCTLAHYKIPVKLVVFNNNELAKISLEQDNAHFPVWETSLTNPNFAQLAQNCGMKAIRVEEAADLEAAIQNIFSSAGPALLEILTNPKLN